MSIQNGVRDITVHSISNGEMQSLARERKAVVNNFLGKITLSNQGSLGERIVALGELYVDLHQNYANIEKITKTGVDILHGMLFDKADRGSAVAYLRYLAYSDKISVMQELQLFKEFFELFYSFGGIYTQKVLEKAAAFIPEFIMPYNLSDTYVFISMDDQNILLNSLREKTIEEKDYPELAKLDEWIKLLLSFLPSGSEDFLKMRVISYFLDIQKNNLGESYVLFLDHLKNQEAGHEENFLSLASYLQSVQGSLEEKSNISQSILDIYKEILQELKKSKLSRIPENLHKYPRIMSLLTELNKFNGSSVFEINQETAFAVQDKMTTCLAELQHSPDNLDIYFNYLNFVFSACATYFLSMKNIVVHKAQERFLCRIFTSEESSFLHDALEPQVKQDLQKYFENENEEIFQVFKQTGVQREINVDWSLVEDIARSGNLESYHDLLEDLKSLLTSEMLTETSVNLLQEKIISLQELSLQDSKNLIEKISNCLSELVLNIQQESSVLVCEIKKNNLDPLIDQFDLAFIKAHQMFIDEQIKNLNFEKQLLESQWLDLLQSAGSEGDIFLFQVYVTYYEQPTQELDGKINRFYRHFQQLQQQESEKKEKLLIHELKKSANLIA